MTDNVIKVAKQMKGFMVHEYIDKPTQIQIPFIGIGINVDDEAGMRLVHQLLMLAVCEKLKWGIGWYPGSSIWYVASFGGDVITDAELFADLPLAVINAAAKEVEG